MWFAGISVIFWEAFALSWSSAVLTKFRKFQVRNWQQNLFWQIGQSLSNRNLPLLLSAKSFRKIDYLKYLFAETLFCTLKGNVSTENCRPTKMKTSDIWQRSGKIKWRKYLKKYLKGVSFSDATLKLDYLKIMKFSSLCCFSLLCSKWKMFDIHLWV